MHGGKDRYDHYEIHQPLCKKHVGLPEIYPGTEGKEHSVFFEKENINTMDSKGEVLLTIMASLAQQESQSLSRTSSWACSTDTEWRGAGES